MLSNENALPWGLAFGYAYAGSVAMIATALNDITYVMVAGHIIAFLTITWMHKKILRRVLKQHDIDVEVQRIVATDRSIQPQPTKQEEHAEINHTNNEEVWQDDKDVKWDGEVGKTIGEDVEWNDVIEMDD